VNSRYTHPTSRRWNSPCGFQYVEAAQFRKVKGAYDTVRWCGSAIEGGTRSVDQTNARYLCRTLGVRSCLRKKDSTANDVSCGPGTNSRSPTSAVGESEGDERSDEKRGPEETDDVSRRAEADRSRTTRSVGKGQGGAGEGCLRGPLRLPSLFGNRTLQSKPGK
jgi:hypothetical protein